MAASFSRPDPTSPTSIAEAGFPTSRRGFNTDEVRAFLISVAAEMGRLRERERQLQAEVVQAKQQSMVAPEIDDDTVTRYVGEETTRVLQTARESAASIKQHAEEAASELLRDANEQAKRIRQEANEEAARRRQSAADEAESLVAAAKDEGRDMVHEARAYRERVLADLDKRTKIAKAQVEELAQSRDRLLQVFQRARLVAVDVANELQQMDGPEQLVNLAPTTGPVPLMVPSNRRQPGDTLQQPANDQEAGGKTPQPADDRAKTPSDAGSAAPSPPAESADADTTDALERPEPFDRSDEVTDTDGSVVRADTTALAASPSANPADIAEGTSADVDEVDEVDDAHDRVSDDAEAPGATDHADRVGANVVSLFPGAPAAADEDETDGDDEIGEQHDDAADPQASEEADDEATDDSASSAFASAEAEASNEVGVADETEALDVAGGASVHDHQQDAEVTAEVDTAAVSGEPDNDPAPAGAPDPAASIFARLRDQVPPEAATEASSPIDGGNAASTDSVQAPEIADDTGSDGELVADNGVNRAEVDEALVEPDETPFEVRDATIAPLITLSARALKRVLADEQNGVLKQLRTVDNIADPDQLLAADSAHVAAYVDAISDALLDAALAGAAVFGADDTPVMRRTLLGAGAIDSAADLISTNLVAALRGRVERTVADCSGDNESITQRLRSVYREFKTQHIDHELDDVFRTAYGRGMAVAAPKGTPIKWTVDDRHQACPDCEDNSLAGFVPAGDEFPTGHTSAPAHPGCRCLTLATP